MLRWWDQERERESRFCAFSIVLVVVGPPDPTVAALHLATMSVSPRGLRSGISGGILVVLQHARTLPYVLQCRIGCGGKGRSNVHHVSADAEDHAQLPVIPRRCQIRTAGSWWSLATDRTWPPHPFSRLKKWDPFDR